MLWEQVWAILGVTGALFLTSIGVTVSLFIWNRSESRSDFRHLEASVNTNLAAIREEMKDFHTRLAIQDLEFKMRMCDIERSKVK